MKTVLIFSGGMDSTVALYWLTLVLERDVLTLSVDYGQRHRKELEYAARMSSALGVKHVVADLSAIQSLLGKNSQTDRSVDVPEGHYAEESMKLTVVPNRNMIMLATAAGYAMAEGADSVAYAAHAGDHAIYPDCRPEFADALSGAIALADWKAMKLERPFITFSKRQIALLGKQLGVDFNKTWSCYKGGEIHCGKCGTCVERKEALYGFDNTAYSDCELPF
jgi:7-cyano-7-deazaguanine synthase